MPNQRRSKRLSDQDGLTLCSAGTSKVSFFVVDGARFCQSGLGRSFVSLPVPAPRDGSGSGLPPSLPDSFRGPVWGMALGRVSPPSPFDRLSRAWTSVWVIAPGVGLSLSLSLCLLTVSVRSPGLPGLPALHPAPAMVLGPSGEPAGTPEMASPALPFAANVPGTVYFDYYFHPPLTSPHFTRLSKCQL